MTISPPRYPLHASCELDWSFSESCDSVKNKIVDQINAWDVSIESSILSSLSCPDRGLPDDQSWLHQAPLRPEVPLQADRQRGELRHWDSHHSSSEVLSTLLGDILTVVFRYVDSLTFDFSDMAGTGCAVKATSRADKT